MYVLHFTTLALAVPMSIAPDPSDIFERSVKEGERRLDQSLLELLATGFIAGFTVVFGIVAMGIVHSMVEPQLGKIAELAGALAFGVGLVFLIVGRAELFNENFFDPVATFASRRKPKILGKILRLWVITFVLNLIGGALFALVFSFHGVLSPEASSALVSIAEEIVHRGPWTGFMSAIIGGALVTLLSFLLLGANSVASRIALAYATGVLLAIGPFDHVVVSALHVFIGILLDGHVSFVNLFEVMGVVTAGNLVGGVGLVTLSHVAQAKGAEESDGG